MVKQTITVKIGGRMATNDSLLAGFIKELKSLGGTYSFVVIHGGGKEVSELSEKLLGKPPVFVDGVRMTSIEEMDVVEMVLSGKVNKRLVRLLQSNNVPAVGLCGADAKIYLGASLSAETRTGRVSAVDTTFISLLIKTGYVPVISSTTMDNSGGGININADEAALELAASLEAAALLYLSDIPGVLKNGAVIPRLTPALAREEIKQGVINGGMIVKVESAIGALERGVKKIIIGEYADEGALERLLCARSGTSICPLQTGKE